EVQRHQHQHLHLLDVVGGAGDEGGCAVAAHLLGGEAVHAGVDRAADVPARAHRDPGAEPDRGDRGDDLDHRDTEHEAADTPDVGGVAGGHAVVDDVRVEAGQVEGREDGRELEDDHGPHVRQVGPQVVAEEGPEHGRSPGTG